MQGSAECAGMKPEKALANPPGQHFWQEGNAMCLPDLATAKTL